MSQWNDAHLGGTLLDNKNNNQKTSSASWFTLGHLQSKIGKQVKFYYRYSFSKPLFSGHWKKENPHPPGISQIWDAGHILVAWRWGSCFAV